MFNERGEQFFATIANSISGLSGDLVLILIYVAFLFTAQAGWSHKLDMIFRDPQTAASRSARSATKRELASSATSGSRR
jgi:AI-2 transport protein TqsA